MMIRRFAVLALMLPLAGCISFGAKPPPALMSLSAATPVAAGTTRTTSDEKSVAVNIPTVQPALATQRVMVQDGPNSVAYVPKALWAGSPALLFRNLLAETITAKTGRFVPDQRATGLQPDLRVSGQLVQFGVDAPARQAVVIFDGVLAHAGSTTLQTRRFEAHAPIAAVNEGDVAAGVNQAANQVAADVAAWVGAN
ncbi:cholesterol transport system auxiliary component [Sphingomonas vulcanisoli]|uniref:Cholesterol transport system auxiliary component n=1 Tax=Sphingomonas vulcanisoli TaxID=1658060 RepID=A0ABX0TPI8_9SPHN|nr:ABC-type transport auxiliary lipoprotein family protein [Sphingomonas vulcanisoli]NIJ07453.1 cholesterol transport system auxiliary component [Sphingomonas vulcanisoli]